MTVLRRHISFAITPAFVVLLLLGSSCPNSTTPPEDLAAARFQEPTSSIVEGDEGELSHPVTVTLNQEYANPVMVVFEVSGVTASNDDDFVAIERDTVVIAPGQVSADVSATVLGDDLDESDETFEVSIIGVFEQRDASDVPLLFDETPHVVTILDDDDEAGGGDVIATGVFDCPDHPEGLQVIEGGWGPLTQDRLLLVGHGSGVSFIDLTANPPGVLTVPGVFHGVTFTQPVYGAVAVRTPDGPWDGLFAFGSPGSNYFQSYVRETSSFGLNEVMTFGTVLDATLIGGVNPADGVTYVDGPSYYLRTCCWATDSHLQSGAAPVSAFRSFEGDAPTVFVTGGTPGNLMIDDAGASPAVLVGAVGDDPRRVRVKPPVGAISNYGSDHLTIFTWDGTSMSPEIRGTTPAGDGPVGLDLIAVSEGTWAVVNTGYNDNSYTVTRLNASGGVLSTSTVPAPAGITQPGHAVFARDATGIKIIMTGNGSGNFAIVESGL